MKLIEEIGFSLRGKKKKIFSIFDFELEIFSKHRMNELV